LKLVLFAPFSDTNLSEKTLKEALSSTLLEKNKDNHHLLTETSGGCALWNRKNGSWGF
jgi:hypothetical protein